LPGYVSREIMFKEKLAEWREEPLKELSDIMESLFGNKNHG
jgi:hypothetical protein